MKFQDVLRLLHQKPSEREKRMFFGFLGITALIYFQTYFYPKYQENKTLNAALEASYRVVVVPKGAKKAGKRWGGTAQALEEAPLRILDPVYLQNIEVLGMQTSQIASEGPWSKRDVTLSASGSYHALEGYLSYLQNMPAPLMIKNLNIKMQETDAEVLQMELTGVVYGSN